jgi:PleD family two-component response regulator
LAGRIDDEKVNPERLGGEELVLELWAFLPSGTWRAAERVRPKTEGLPLLNWEIIAR